jgi:hypothetical protein
MYSPFPLPETTVCGDDGGVGQRCPESDAGLEDRLARAGDVAGWPCLQEGLYCHGCGYLLVGTEEVS